MLLLDPIQLSPPRNKQPAYQGGMDLARYAELLSTDVSSSAGKKYVFHAGSNWHTVQSAREIDIQKVLDIAQMHIANFQFLGAVVQNLPVAIRQIESQQMEESPDWLTAVNFRKSSRSVAAIERTIDSLLCDLNGKGPVWISKQLERVNCEDANEYHILAVLRTLFRGREEITSWRTLEQRTRAALASRKIPVDIVMKGLEENA